jgi:hypothetical protein
MSTCTAPDSDPPYPIVRAHLLGQGRVFYTAMKYREKHAAPPAFLEIVFDENLA